MLSYVALPVVPVVVKDIADLASASVYWVIVFVIVFPLLLNPVENVNTFSLPLNVFQSAEVNNPLVFVEAFGKVNSPVLDNANVPPVAFKLNTLAVAIFELLPTKILAEANVLVTAPISPNNCAGVLVTNVLVVDVGSAVNTGIWVEVLPLDALNPILPLTVIPANVGVAPVWMFCGKLNVHVLSADKSCTFGEDMFIWFVVPLRVNVLPVGTAPISPTVHVYVIDPSTDLVVFPIVKFLAVVHTSAVPAVATLRFETLVVEATENGAVPVATLDTSCEENVCTALNVCASFMNANVLSPPKVGIVNVLAVFVT
jgi:hypothetical protein